MCYAEEDLHADSHRRRSFATVNRYLVYSKSSYYAIIGSLPLLAAYELLVLASKHGQVEVRNAADVWLRSLLALLGLTPTQAYLVMILALVLAVPLFKERHVTLVPRYFLLMLGEAFGYSLALGFAISVLLEPLFYAAGALFSALGPWRLGGETVLGIPAGGGLMQAIGQSLGAGLFEEFFFRVILLNTLLGATRLMLREWLAALVSILGAAFLFALAHYLGPMGDRFELQSFLFRWMAGLLFTVLYYLRGFAITAYAHTLYDIRVLLF